MRYVNFFLNIYFIQLPFHERQFLLYLFMKLLQVLCDFLGMYRISLWIFVHVWDHTASPSYFFLSRKKLTILFLLGKGEAMFHRKEHQVINKEEDATGKFIRRNCQHCALSGKQDMKTVYLCEKCKVLFHIFCFKERIRTFLYPTVFSFFLSFIYITFSGWKASTHGEGK